jgi:predicted small metal-binding protein
VVVRRPRQYAWIGSVDKEKAEMKEFKCGALVPGCDAKFAAESEDEILEHIAAHARDEHGMDEVPPEVVDKILASISER